MLPHSEISAFTETYLSIDEAAALFSFHRTTISRMIRNGELKYVQIGRLKRIPSSQIATIKAGE